MRRFSIKDKVLYSVLALVVIGSLYVMFVTSMDFNKQRRGTANVSTTQSHDETNSDGHHNKDTEEATGPATDLTGQAQVTIDIKDFAYSQQNIKIKKGTTVTWTNQDTVEHNVMKEHSNDSNAHDAPSDSAVNPTVLAGPLLAKGESYSFTFNEVSANPYHCSPHPYMKGSVTVVE